MLKRNLNKMNFELETEGGLPVRVEHSTTIFPGREPKLYGKLNRLYLLLVSANKANCD